MYESYDQNVIQRMSEFDQLTVTSHFRHRWWWQVNKPSSCSTNCSDMTAVKKHSAVNDKVSVCGLSCSTWGEFETLIDLKEHDFKTCRCWRRLGSFPVILSCFEDAGVTDHLFIRSSGLHVIKTVIVTAADHQIYMFPLTPWSDSVFIVTMMRSERFSW